MRDLYPEDLQHSHALEGAGDGLESVQVSWIPIGRIRAWLSDAVTSVGGKMRDPEGSDRGLRFCALCRPLAAPAEKTRLYATAEAVP